MALDISTAAPYCVGMGIRRGEKPQHLHAKIVDFIGLPTMAEMTGRTIPTCHQYKYNGIHWPYRRRVQDWLVKNGRPDMIPRDFLGVIVIRLFRIWFGFAFRKQNIVADIKMTFRGWREPTTELLHPFDVYPSDANPNRPFCSADINFAHHMAPFIDPAATLTLRRTDRQ